MYELELTGQFKKDVKSCQKGSYDMSLLATALDILKNTGTLPVVPYKTHKLTGQKNDVWDAHIKPDWILLFGIQKNDNPEFEGTVKLIRTGTHAKLFGNSKIGK